MAQKARITIQDYFTFEGDSAAALDFLVRFGALAPSSHNTQPWSFRMDYQNQTIEVWGDERRALPASDPDNRELYISLGCAIENILVAAEYYDLPNHVIYFPNSEKPLLAARIVFSRVVARPDEARDPRHLVFRIDERHANREPFRMDLEPPEAYGSSVSARAPEGIEVRFVSDPDTRGRIAKIVADATEDAFHDGGFTRELSHWIKPSLASYRDGMPGYNIGIPWPVSFVAPLAIRFGNVAKQQRAMVEKMLRNAPMFGIISATLDDPSSWVKAGQLLERAWLLAHSFGLKMGVLAAPIEIKEHYRELADVLGVTSRPVAFFRVGSTDRVPKRSPRRNFRDVFRR